METVDFLVVGAGIAGASVAYELAAHGSTLIVEAERVAGYHSTGRSAALYTPNYGSPVVRALNAAGHAFFAAPPEDFSDRPLLTPRGALTLARPGEEARLEAVLALSTPAHPIERIPVAEALRLAPVVRPEVVAGAAFEAGVTDMDVAAIHQGFVAGFRRRGGRLRLGARLGALAREGAGWRATVGGDAIAAGVVVDAAGAWGDEVARIAGVGPVGLVAKRRTVIAVPAPELPGAAEMPLVEFAGAEAYFKADTGRIIASPGDETPVPAQDVQPEEIDVAVTMDWLARHTRLELRAVANKWAGLRSFVADHAPVVGFAPEASGFFWLVGQGGYGIMMAPTLARLAARLAAGARADEAFAGLALGPADLAPDRPALARAA